MSNSSGNNQYTTNLSSLTVITSMLSLLVDTWQARNTQACQIQLAATKMCLPLYKLTVSKCLRL